MSVAEREIGGRPTAESAPLPASFRDPAGVVFRRDGVLYRQVNAVHREDWERFTGGLYQRLVDRGLLVAHEEVDVEPIGPGAIAILRPEPIPFVSYPYEWSFGQLKDAALLTLDLQLAALDAGMSLKDASAYNVQFCNGRPIFIDTLSFETYVEGKPWPAYRQFCQHFLAPLALMAKVDVRLGQLLRVHLDGVPLDLASRLLPRRTWWSPGLLSHLHLHARVQRAYAQTGGERPKSRGGRVPKAGLVALLQGLRRLVEKLEWKPEGTEWGSYYEDTNYTEAAFETKRATVRAFLDAIAPSSLWDLGANTGVFSRLASERGIPTVAFDVDPAAVEKNYRRLRAEGPAPLLPLVLDLTNPSPGLGWASEERDGLLARGPVGCAMALALVHHLAISNNVPLPRIAAFLRRAADHLIIEFVPKEDSQVQRLLSGREDIFPDYHQEGFEAAFQREFVIERRVPIEGSQRTLYWMRAAHPRANGEETT